VLINTNEEGLIALVTSWPKQIRSLVAHEDPGGKSAARTVRESVALLTSRKATRGLKHGSVFLSFRYAAKILRGRCRAGCSRFAGVLTTATG